MMDKETVPTKEVDGSEEAPSKRMRLIHESS